MRLLTSGSTLHKETLLHPYMKSCDVHTMKVKVILFKAMKRKLTVFLGCSAQLLIWFSRLGNWQPIYMLNNSYNRGDLATGENLDSQPYPFHKSLDPKKHQVDNPNVLAVRCEPKIYCGTERWILHYRQCCGKTFHPAHIEEAGFTGDVDVTTELVPVWENKSVYQKKVILESVFYVNVLVDGCFGEVS